MEVVAIANQKGGCGKTTTAVNLSACLAVKGKRVLLIDLDPQGSATTHLAVRDFENTMYEAMMADLSLSEIITPTEINSLDIIPADKRLGVNGGVKLSTYGGIKLITYLKSLLPA